MSKYIPPRSRKAQEVSTLEAEKRRQRQLRFSKENDKGDQNGKTQRKKSGGWGPGGRSAAPQYGFVSRGEDSRLQHSEEAQREYFEWILQTFEGNKTTVKDFKASGSMKEVQNGNQTSQKDQKKDNIVADGRSTSNQDKNTSASAENAKERATGSIDSTLAALRKLREAMLHQKPTEFSVKVHLFSVRVAAPVGHYQTYIPSINYLLSSGLLTSDEKNEIATLLVLHVSHHNHQDEKAFRIFQQYHLQEKSSHLYSVLVAWSTGDFYRWLAMFNGENDPCIYSIMTGGLSKMMGHMVLCMTQAYFTLLTREFEDKFLPRGMLVGEFLEKYALKWKIEEGSVVIRDRRAGKR
ncbi:CIC11C00000001112 [Sungouiella intermedia]|uniref:CIC11C00000001112 n=1 Tax=Sungouiella intermedia TaxID=45354 RepID=A0A1L0D510_9ASCO|nr:CIC11C00000001112 [[Candida] intermedia]